METTDFYCYIKLRKIRYHHGRGRNIIMFILPSSVFDFPQRPKLVCGSTSIYNLQKNWQWKM